MIKPRKTDKSA